MSADTKKSFTRWSGLISLIIFGALVGWDFDVVQSVLRAVITAIVIATVFVIVTKLAGIEPGWPKK